MAKEMNSEMSGMSAERACTYGEDAIRNVLSCSGEGTGETSESSQYQNSRQRVYGETGDVRLYESIT